MSLVYVLSHQLVYCTLLHRLSLNIQIYCKKELNLIIYSVRGVLNTSTGELTITGLTRNDSGNYTVEINNQVTKPIQLLVICK